MYSHFLKTISYWFSGEKIQDFFCFLLRFYVKSILVNINVLKPPFWHFETLNSPTLISRKIWVAENFWNFHIVSLYTVVRRNFPIYSLVSTIGKFCLTTVYRGAEPKCTDSLSNLLKEPVHLGSAWLSFKKSKILISRKIEWQKNCWSSILWHICHTLRTIIWQRISKWLNP